MILQIFFDFSFWTIGIILTILTAIWIYNDAKQLGMDPTGYVLLTCLTSFCCGGVVYLIARSNYTPQYQQTYQQAVPPSRPSPPTPPSAPKPAYAPSKYPPSDEDATFRPGYSSPDDQTIRQSPVRRPKTEFKDVLDQDSYPAHKEKPKYCPFCGTEIIDEANFCSSCGNKID